MIFRAIVVATSFILHLGSATSHAADYPSRPISLVIPSSVGSGHDLLGRLVASELLSQLGRPIIVDTKPGAGTALGSAFVATSAADGYTLLLQTNALAALPAINPNTKFDPKTDFTYISKFATSAMALVVNPKVLPVKSFDELVAAIRANPRKFNYSSAGIGTQHHLSMEMLKSRLQLQVEHVPYKGGAGALNDLLAGHVQLAMSPVNVILPHVTSGQLTLIAVSGNNRSPLVPNAPTFAELGMTELDIDVYFFIAAPPKLPAEIAKRLNSEMSQSLEQPAVRQKFLALGMVPESSSSEDLTNKIRADVDRWKKFITDANIPIE